MFLYYSNQHRDLNTRLAIRYFYYKFQHRKSPKELPTVREKEVGAIEITLEFKLFSFLNWHNFEYMPIEGK